MGSQLIDIPGAGPNAHQPCKHWLQLFLGINILAMVTGYQREPSAGTLITVRSHVC